VLLGLFGAECQAGKPIAIGVSPASQEAM